MTNRTAIQRLKTSLATQTLELPYLLPVAPIDDSWLNSQPVILVPTEDNEKHTAHMPAFTKLLHERKETQSA